MLQGRIRKQIRELVPYDIPEYSGMIKLDANENNYDFPSEVRERIFSLVNGQTFTRYPDPKAASLREHLADYADFPASQILVGNGSDELIQNLMLAFAMHKKAFITTPTFGMYRIHAEIAGAIPVAIPRKKKYQVDTDAILEAAMDPEAGILILCSPNNPTGNIVSLETVEVILKNTDMIVVVDEAYYEFCGQTAAQLLHKYPQLVVLRSLSKAFGLAGLRVGYMLAGAEVTGIMNRIKQPFNVNVFSQLAAKVLLESRSIFETQIQEICASRAELHAALEGMPGLKPFSSAANFIMFQVEGAASVYEELLNHNILIRLLDSPELPDCLRVSVGKPEENRVFVQVLEKILRRRESYGKKGEGVQENQ